MDSFQDNVGGQQFPSLVHAPIFARTDRHHLGKFRCYVVHLSVGLRVREFMFLAIPICIDSNFEFQDPKIEVPYNTRLYFVEIFPYIALTYLPI